MVDILTWAALLGAGGSVIAIVTFWFSRGKAEAEAATKAESAAATATAALMKADMLSAQLADARVEIRTRLCEPKDLAAAEMRFAAALEALKTELRGMNTRLDRIIENFTNRA